MKTPIRLPRFRARSSERSVDPARAGDSETAKHLLRFYCKQSRRRCGKRSSICDSLESMRILLIGALGQLGTDLRQVLGSDEVLPVDKEEIDICDPAQVDALADSFRPD